MVPSYLVEAPAEFDPLGIEPTLAASWIEMGHLWVVSDVLPLTALFATVVRHP